VALRIVAVWRDNAMPAYYHPPRTNTPTEMTLAGQPQEPWQSPEHDQARPAWQSYSPSAADGQDTYGYPQSGSGAQGAPAPQNYGQSYAQQSGYAAAPPSYTVQDKAFGDQTYADNAFADNAFGDNAFGDQGYQSQQQQQQSHAAPHWQAVAGLKNARAKQSGDSKGFLGSLFDFSFTSFVTPKIIKVLYILITIWTVIWALIFLRYGFKYGGAAGGFFTLIVVDPILILITLGAYRMVLELFMVVHRMHEDLKAVRERGES
jgi:uncharacterized membrane protein